MFTITKRFEFSASHVLAGLPEDHPCARLHGHNYAVEVELASSKLNDVGFVFDYRALAPFKTLLDDELDHRHLNDVIPGQPSAELLAMWLYQEACHLLPGAPVVAVRVSETPKTWAEYRP